MKAVSKLHVHNADLTQQTVSNHGARLLNQLMTGITVGHADDLLLRFTQLLQFLSFSGGETQRFFTHHVQPGAERSAADSKVRIVRRGDGDGFNAISTRGFRFKQGFVIAIAALRRHAQRATKRPPALRINIKRTRH
jgi:hypothetical protein